MIWSSFSLTEAQIDGLSFLTLQYVTHFKMV